MSEIEKMYKNAGVEPRCIGCYYNLPCCRNCNKNYKDTINKTCKYQIVKEEYPPFTAEKQIELVCFLINRGVELSFNCEQGKINTQAIQRGLAGLINNLWQDLTEQERAEIAEILRG